MVRKLFSYLPKYIDFDFEYLKDINLRAYLFSRMTAHLNVISRYLIFANRRNFQCVTELNFCGIRGSDFRNMLMVLCYAEITVKRIRRT